MMLLDTMSEARRTLRVMTPQHFFWAHPEWWAAVLCGAAWVALLVRGWQHAGHEMHHRMSVPQEVQHWLLMVAAMMLPLLFETLRWTAEGSLWARRHRAMAGFLAGYTGPWLAFGLLAAVLRQGPWSHSNMTAGLGFSVAAWWGLTSWHRRAIKECHRVRPLAPVGWQADGDCLRFGGAVGVACVWSCWPLMLACTFAGHGLVAIIGGAVLGWVERRSRQPYPRAVLAGTLALAGYYVWRSV